MKYAFYVEARVSCIIQFYWDWSSSAHDGLCVWSFFSELELSLYLFEVALFVLPLNELSQLFFERWICAFMFVYVVEFV